VDRRTSHILGMVGRRSTWEREDGASEQRKSGGRGEERRRAKEKRRQGLPKAPNFEQRRLRYAPRLGVAGLSFDLYVPEFSTVFSKTPLLVDSILTVRYSTIIT
jgi:hypothetical protein